MRTGGYTLHVYCDRADCAARFGDPAAHGRFGEFGGTDGRTAAAEAKRAGWRKEAVGDALRDVCPECVRERPPDLLRTA